MEEKIIKILREINSDIPEDITVNILNTGIIDSFDVVNIVAELESCFAIEIDAEEIIPENFETVRAIINLVKKYI